MFDLFAPLIIGFVGSLHCLGMCGPLVMAYSLHIRPSIKDRIADPTTDWLKGLSHHGAFHLGRVCTYGILGGGAAGLAHLASFDQLFAGLRSGLTLIGGVLIILFGLLLLKIFPLPITLQSLSPGSLFSRWLPPLFRSQRMVSKVALGLAAGFLPCMLSWAMIIKAATTQSPMGGFLTMFSFGLGTMPALFFPGLSASLLSLKARFLGERVAAISVIAMGWILVYKGAASI
jgi:sulfite exporter TauE/SafE